MRVTLGDAQASRLPIVVSACGTDQRFIDLLNEAQQRLLYEGKWFGTVGRYKFCAQDGCITLPRQIAAIEAVNVCGFPNKVRDFWYEFLEFGLGSLHDGCGTGGCGPAAAIMRGNFPTFADIVGLTSKLQLVCDEVTDAGKTVLVLGWDQNGNWIRSLQGASIADGEVVALAQGAGGQSNNYFSVVSDIQPPTNLDGQWWLYTNDFANGNALRLIGQYDYDNLRPSFARYLLPAVRSTLGCATTNPPSCVLTSVEILGKLAWIPAKNPTDYLLIGNLPALKDMIMALNIAENESNPIAKAQIIAAGIQTAKISLEAELDHQFGIGRRMGMTITHSPQGDADTVLNFI